MNDDTSQKPKRAKRKLTVSKETVEVLTSNAPDPKNALKRENPTMTGNCNMEVRRNSGRSKPRKPRKG